MSKENIGRNAEHYADPTPTAAMRNICRDEYQKEAARLDRIGDIVPPAAPDGRYRRVRDHRPHPAEGQGHRKGVQVMERAETIIAACRDTMLTTLEKIGGQSLICSWTRQDGSVVKLALEIRTSNQTTIGDAIRDMDDEEMARKLVPAVLALCDDGAPSEDTVRDWLERPQSDLKV